MRNFEWKEDKTMKKRSLLFLFTILAFFTMAVTASSLTFNITSLTFLVTLCDKPPPVDKNYVESMYFGPSRWNIKGFITACSHGTWAFEPHQNLVIPVNIPCFGTSPRSGRRYNHTLCGSNEIHGWAETAEDYALAVLGVDYRRYSKRWLLLPQVNCGWNGLGSVGGVHAWIKGGHTTIIDTYLHEYGHTFGLQHSSVQGSEYGDSSSPMGNCCDTPRCYNAAQQLQLEWTGLLHDIKTSPTPHRWTYYDLPALVNPGRQHVIRLMGMYYISFRSAIPGTYDSGVRSTYINKLNVHIFRADYGNMTQLEALISPGNIWRIADMRIAIRHVNLTINTWTAAPMSTRVGFCAYPTSFFEDNCVDGLDNDCDGLFDAEDPDCVVTIPTSYATIKPCCNNDGVCDFCEFAWNCGGDCLGRCGDRFCDKMRGENVRTCPWDCTGRCGDGVCHGQGLGNETWKTCRQDCPAPTQVCGDGLCVDLIEDRLVCPLDCCPPARCGDGRCDSFGGEDCMSCPQDCVRDDARNVCCGRGGPETGCKNSACSAGLYVCRTTCSATESASVNRTMI